MHTANLQTVRFGTLEPLRYAHNEYGYGKRYVKYTIFKPWNREQAIAKQNIQIAKQRIKPSGAEDNPAEYGKGEGEEHLGGVAESGEEFCLGCAVGQGDGGDSVAVAAVLAEEYQGQEQEGVVGSPSNKRPVGTMPKA